MPTIKRSTLNLLSVAIVITLTTGSIAKAEDSSCKLALLTELGWDVRHSIRAPQTNSGNQCAGQADKSPIFYYNPKSEAHADLSDRASRALYSTATRCMVNREYSKSLKTAIGKLTANRDFKFLSGGTDPRDPFNPPGNSWLPSPRRGYDIPATRSSTAIEALYTQPFVAECSAAIQIAQAASAYEHYKLTFDDMLHPAEIGIGIWREYAKSPALAANRPLLLTERRTDHLKSLASLGRNAFYGQSGYLRNDKGLDYVDSLDNLGQNFVIVDISDEAINSLAKRRKPTKALARLTRKIWKKYYKRLRRGEKKKDLSQQLGAEMASADAFFSGTSVYVHPLKVKTIAEHLARQFIYNPRSPYIVEIYQDLLNGYVFDRHIKYKLANCRSLARCRKIDRKIYTLTNANGDQVESYRSMKECNSELHQN